MEENRQTKLLEESIVTISKRAFWTMLATFLVATIFFIMPFSTSFQSTLRIILIGTMFASGLGHIGSVLWLTHLLHQTRR